MDHSNASWWDLIDRCYASFDAGDRGRLLGLLTDPFEFGPSSPQSDNRLLVGRADAADLLILTHHAAAADVTTTLLELVSGGAAFGVVGRARRQFTHRSPPEVVEFAHLWYVEDDRLLKSVQSVQALGPVLGVG